MANALQKIATMSEIILNSVEKNQKNCPENGYTLHPERREIPGLDHHGAPDHHCSYCSYQTEYNKRSGTDGIYYPFK